VQCSSAAEVARSAKRRFLGTPERPARARQLSVEDVADLCLLHAPPRETIDALTADLVRATYAGGRVINP
jgi:hypothetical protein